MLAEELLLVGLEWAGEYLMLLDLSLEVFWVGDRFIFLIIKAISLVHSKWLFTIEKIKQTIKLIKFDISTKLIVVPFELLLILILTRNAPTLP